MILILILLGLISTHDDKECISFQTRKVSMLGHILIKDDRSLKVGARSLWTMAERKMRVKGIPMIAYTMQAVFPVFVKGWMWP